MGDDRSWAWNLGLEWSKEPPGVVSTFTPAPEHRGRAGFLHGGLAATVLDETMAALGIVLDGVQTVTATLTVKYRQPVPLDGSPLRTEAWREAARAGRKIQQVHGRLLLPDGTVAVEASGLFVRVSSSD
jgi:acyl-coenzyme A thioesterase PaaI-like protein